MFFQAEFSGQPMPGTSMHGMSFDSMSFHHQSQHLHGLHAPESELVDHHMHTGPVEYGGSDRSSFVRL